jgi:prepilin-type N-terminal cleavage/methylation domain-containing protein
MRVLGSTRRVTDDDGFSLVEMIVALTIAAIAFSALGLALISGARASLLSQQNQQAGDLLSQSVEQARVLGYDGLAMRATDLGTGESVRTPTLATCLCYAPNTDLTSGTGVEPLAGTDPAGGISPHVTSFVQNGLSYRVRQYVTSPVDAFGATYKRLSVVVSWSSLGKPHTRKYSTIVTPTRRGLPLPDYKFTATGSGLSQCRNPGSGVVYSFTLKNNGARDAWGLAASGSGAWSFFADTNASGSYDTGDLSMSVSGADTTGLIEPTGQTSFFAVSTIPSAGASPPPYTWTTTFRATSAAQPGYFNDLTTSTVVQVAACGGVLPTSPATTPATTAPPTPPTQPAASCSSLTGPVNTSAPSGTMVRYYLNNPSQPSSTNASLDMPVVRDSGTTQPADPLYAYSQDQVASAGRYLQSGTSGTAVDLASWTYQMGAASILKGTGSITLWATTASGITTQAPAFSVTLELLNSDGTVADASFATASYTTPASGWGCAGFRPVSLSFGSFNGSGTPVGLNQKLRIKVKVTNAVPVLLAYGTAGYPTEMQLPVSVGLG